VLLLRNKDQEYNNPLAGFATCLCRQRIGHERTAQCTVALCVPGASRPRFCPDGPRVYLSGPAYMPSCLSPEGRFPLD